MQTFCIFNRLKNDAHPGMQDLGNAAQHAERMAFIVGRFKATDLLLGSLEEFRQLFLGESSLLAQSGNLQRHIPGLTGMLEAGGNGRVLQLFFKILVKIGLFHSRQFYTEIHS